MEYGAKLISFDPMWQTIKEMNKGKKITGLSSTTVAKIGKNESVTLDVVDRICTALQVPIESVVEITPIRSLCGVPGTKSHQQHHSWK